MKILNQLKIFAVILHIFVKAKGENSGPFCKLGYLSGWGVNPTYDCFNFRSFPANLSNPEKIGALYFGSQNNKFPILKTGQLITSKITNLKGLVLNNCEIKSIEKGTFRGGNKLIRLYLAYNKINELDLSVFQDLPNLQFLWLGNNPIENILGEGLQLKTLTVLALYKCKLRSINPSWFKDLKSLTRLYLEGNQLTTIDWKVFRPFKNIRVSLHDNPFHCDCHLKFLLDYFEKMKINWFDINEKPACNSSSFDELMSESNDLIGINLTMINRLKLFCPPQVVSLQRRKNLQDITYLECEYSGYPEPTVAWKIDGKLLKVDTDNKHLIQTMAAETSDEPNFNYKFKQTLFTFLLPISSNDTKVKFTCQAFNSFFNSNESNPVYLKLLNTENSKVTTYRPTETPELNSIVIVIACVIAFLSGVGIVSGIVLIRHLKKTPRMPKEIYKFLPYYSSRRIATTNNSETMHPQLESNPEVDRTSDCLSSSWDDDDDEYGHIYETPVSVSQPYYNGNAT